MRRILVPCLAAALVLTAVAASPPAVSARPAGDRPFPSRIELPDGFEPEGIAIGPGPTAWLGSLANGDLYRVSLRTGRGEVAVAGTGTPAAGLKVDRRSRVFVAGADSGTARVVDTRSGAVIDYDLGGAFVNDVVLTRRAAWFTDSGLPRLYRVDRGAQGVPSDSATTVRLGGEWEQGTGFGANGISTTPSGRALLVINSTSGVLYRVDPATGDATVVDLGGASLTMGDGMLRHGRTLYVVRNQLAEIAVLRLDRRGSSARLVRTITAADLDDSTSFDVPTTVAKLGRDLYLPNARFGTEATPTTDYWVTRVRARP